jgi:hypothetical protein
LAKYEQSVALAKLILSIGEELWKK